MKKFISGLGINILLLGIISFLTDVSSEMILAILPLFIASLGGAGIAIGLIGGIGDSVASLLKVFSGYWSDRLRKRKPFAFFGYSISSVAKLFFPFIASWTQLLILRPLERVGKGVRDAPRDALIAASSKVEVRGKAFGFHRAMDSSGAFLGALLAFILFWFLKFEFKPILFIAALVSFLALFPFAWVKEKAFADRPQGKSSFRINLRSLPTSFRRYLMVTVVFALGNFTYMFFVLRARDVFQPVFPFRLALTIPILLYCWFNIVYALFSLPGGILSDRIGRKRTLRLGYLAYGLSCVGFAVTRTLASFIILFALYGFSFALVEGNQRAFASVFVEENLRGTALGAFHTAIGISTLIASIFAGILWNFSPKLTFSYGAIMGLVAAISIGSIGKKL
ncbi:MAG: MFS transporter [bacterium]